MHSAAGSGPGAERLQQGEAVHSTPRVSASTRDASAWGASPFGGIGARPHRVDNETAVPGVEHVRVGGCSDCSLSTILILGVTSGHMY